MVTVPVAFKFNIPIKDGMGKLQEHFSDQPCLLVNGFCENFLIKVAKEKIPKRKMGIKLSDQVKIS